LLKRTTRTSLWELGENDSILKSWLFKVNQTVLKNQEKKSFQKFLKNTKLLAQTLDAKGASHPKTHLESA